MTPPVRLVLQSLLAVLLLVGIPLLLFGSCQARLIYYPRAYPAGAVTQWQRQTGGKVVDFTTAQGNQRAFLQGNLASPRQLWIVCGGNATVALDWSEWLRSHAPSQDAWLLVDFPGYGDCEGSPGPASIRENLRAAVPLACRELGWSGTSDGGRLRIFGHSLGGAACLMAASDFHIQRGVMIAPFTSTMDMTRRVIGLPLGFLDRQRYDNMARLAELAERGPGHIVILHGSDDEIVPVSMSRTLAERWPDIVHLREIPGGRHNNIQDAHREELANALREVAGVEL